MPRLARSHLLMLLVAGLSGAGWAQGACRFKSPASVTTVHFGQLQQQTAEVPTRHWNYVVTGGCRNPAAVVLGGASRTMRSAQGAQLPYTAQVQELGGQGRPDHWLTVVFSIPTGAHANLPAGVYADTVSLQVLP